MQDTHILLGRPLGLLGHQGVIRQAKPTAGKQVVAVAVVGKGARLAYQPVDDVPVFDALLAPAAQARQSFDLLLSVPDLEVVGVQADLDPFPDQPAVHRVGVALHVQGAAAIHSHIHALACVDTLRRQRPQHRHLLGQPLLPAAVQLPEHLPHELRVVRPLREVAAAAQQQRLRQCPLELPVTLLRVAVLMRLGRVDGLAAHAVVPEQLRITLLERGPVLARRHGGRQRIGAMHLRHAAQFGQGVLQAFTEALEALAEADRPRLPVGVGQHEVVDQVRKRLAADGDVQPGAVREVGRTQPARFMHLGEKDFLGRAVQRPPLLDVPLQGAHLAVRKTTGILPLQPGEQRLAFQARVDAELFGAPLPDVGKRIGPGSPSMVHTHLAGQLAESPILAGSLVVDPGPGRRLTFAQVQQVEAAQTPDVQIGDHPKPPCREGLRLGYRAQLSGKSNCR